MFQGPQFVPAPTDLTEVMGAADIPIRYKEVPNGICEMDPDVKSYSGYADVDENQHIFWWFFEARNQNASDAPLTVWINGGPGGSSAIGLLLEQGPCRVVPNPKSINDTYPNPYAWNENANVFFLDQPIGVGFSSHSKSSHNTSFP